MWSLPLHAHTPLKKEKEKQKTNQISNKKNLKNKLKRPKKVSVCTEEINDEFMIKGMSMLKIVQCLVKWSRYDMKGGNSVKNVQEVVWRVTNHGTLWTLYIDVLVFSLWW